MTAPFVTREQWGSLATHPAALAGRLPALYIHHLGAPSPPADLAGESLHMRQLQAYAIRPVAQGGKGYSDLDYNLVIGRSGTIYEGRGIDRKSAATLEQNDVSRSICVMGNYQTEEPTIAMIGAVVDAARMMIAAGELDAACIVRGHRDNPLHPGATACPGNNLYAYVPQIAAMIAAPPNPPPPPPNGLIPMESVIISIAGANAVFRAFLDYPTGQVILCEWSGPGGSPLTDRMLALSATLRHLTLPIESLAGATLLGPLPAGDTLHQWSAGEFFRVVP
jgi:N-acetylmuramoyl-L-alanine amidase